MNSMAPYWVKPLFDNPSTKDLLSVAISQSYTVSDRCSPIGHTLFVPDISMFNYGNGKAVARPGCYSYLSIKNVFNACSTSSVSVTRIPVFIDLS